MNSWTSARKGGKKLTLNGEYNVDPPCAKCYCYDYPLLVPNGDAGGAREWNMVGSPNRGIGRTCGAQSREKRRQRIDNQKTRKERNRVPYILSSEIGGKGGEVVLTSWITIGALGSRAVRVRVHIRQKRKTTHITVVSNLNANKE